jgi:spore maturation protein CgeB
MPEGPAPRLAHICIVSSGDEGAMGLSVKRGFEALGRRVTYVPYLDWLPALRGATFRGSGLISRGLAGLTRPAIEVRLVSTLAKLRPDLILFVKCDNLHATAYGAIRRATGAPIIAYHPDDPWNQASLVRRGPAHARAGVQIRLVDAMFLWSRQLVQRAATEGAQRSFYLPFACDPELHPAVEVISDQDRKEFGADVTFIGTWDEEREAWLGPLADAGFDLAIWGSEYWRHRCRHRGLQKGWRGRSLCGVELATAARASKVMVNVLRKQNKGACNMRTFEVPCTGGFMLHERSLEAAIFFPPEVACGDFGTPDELILATRRWLDDPAGRARIAAEGLRRARAWTYREWAERLLERCEGWAA